jgi:hypothetical protein
MGGTPATDPLPELMICRARRIWRCATFARCSRKAHRAARRATAPSRRDRVPPCSGGRGALPAPLRESG